MSITEEAAPNVCPDCAQGKCGNCVNEAWDWRGNRLAPCDCAGHRHQERVKES